MGLLRRRERTYTHTLLRVQAAGGAFCLKRVLNFYEAHALACRCVVLVTREIIQTIQRIETYMR